MEIYLGGFNGLICAEGWGFLEASVACRERKYDGAVAAATIALPNDVPVSVYTGQERWQLNPRTVWLQNVSCPIATDDGNEISNLQVTNKLHI